MKTGDTYIGRDSGLCIKIRNKADGMFELECERRILDKKTGEVTIETRTRHVPVGDMHYVLLGYDRA